MRIALLIGMSLARDAWTRIIRKSQHQLAWCAASEAEALHMSARDTPDVILMDVAVPRMHGADTVRQIMQRNPCPILIVTASIEHDSDIVFQAMGAGAMDAVSTPNIESSAGAVLKKIALLGSLRKPVVKLDRLAYGSGDQGVSHSRHLVVIGCSSGGPAALENVLARLPGDYHSPIVVLQHIDAQFAPHLAGWLAEKTALQVTLAREGDDLEAGWVYIAASGNHLMMNRDSRLYYNVEPRKTYYRPSVDVFFHSVAMHWKHPLTAIVLTGMGQDGANGLLELRERGAYTIAQDEQTSAVYGMPKVAARLGAAMDILPISTITDVLCHSALETAKRCRMRRFRGG